MMLFGKSRFPLQRCFLKVPKVPTLSTVYQPYSGGQVYLNLRQNANHYNALAGS